MKNLTKEQMEQSLGGKLSLFEGMGFMCTAAVILAFSGVFAPIAVAPAIGCAASAAFAVAYPEAK